MGMGTGRQGRHASVRLWGTVLVLTVIALVVVVLTAPGQALLGEHAGAVHGAIHGVSAGLFMITSTIGLFQAYRIFAGKATQLIELQLGSAVNALGALLTILSGNWIYILYRAPSGPRAHFIEHAPEVHKVFFEFKEFAALFTFPIAATAAYLLLRYGRDLYSRRGLSTIVAILLVLTFGYFVMAFGLGAAITKLKSV